MGPDEDEVKSTPQMFSEIADMIANLENKVDRLLLLEEGDEL